LIRLERLRTQQGEARARLKKKSRRRSRGQAVVWLLGTLAASAAVMYGVFNISQLTSAKAKTVNAADAAALAGGVVEARLLNLMAYNNRAMIANEVLVVQLAGIESWMGYFARLSENLGTLLEIIGIVVPILEVVGQYLDEWGDIVKEVRDDVVVPVTKAYIGALEVAKKGMYAAHAGLVVTGGKLANDAAETVVAVNRSQFGTHTDAGVAMDSRTAVAKLTSWGNMALWTKFSKPYSGNNRGDAKQVLLGSRDDWSTNRKGIFWENMDVFGIAGTEKHGETELVGYNRWRTQDTLETWEKFGCKHPPCYTPIAWGRADVNDSDSTYGTMNPNRWAQSLARSEGATNGSSWSGVPVLFDVADRSTDEKAKANLGIDFYVAVARPQANTITSTSLKMGIKTAVPGGSSEMPERLDGNQISALAKARVFFERPKRGLTNDRSVASLARPDSAKEFGSLFSPYWQARLRDLTWKEKSALLVAMGHSVAEAAAITKATPGGQD
jgi:hypothetical protein